MGNIPSDCNKSYLKKILSSLQDQKRKLLKRNSSLDFLSEKFIFINDSVKDPTGGSATPGRVRASRFNSSKRPDVDF